jgi:hypothetical protein
MGSIIGDAAEYNRAAKAGHWASLCDVTLRFVHPDLVKLHDVWNAEAGAAGIPFRRSLSPRVLKPFLRDIAIYERIGEGETRRYRVRLMGTSFAQILTDLTGKFVDEAVPAAVLPRWYGALDTTLGMKAPLRFLGREDTNDMSFLTGEFFSAPLLSDDGQMTMVIGSARYSGKRPWEEVEAEVRRTLGLE